MNYAIIRSGSRQYQVKVGDKVIIDRLSDDVGKEIEFKDVLMTREGETIQIGTPTVASKVVGKIVRHLRGEKIYVEKFKAKVHYRRRTGFRADQTEVEITKIA
jgi:large subunit ribosomal protein L21